MHRRTFLKNSLASAGLVAGLSKLNLTGLAAENPPAKPAVLNLCSQEWLVPGKSIKEKAEKILKWGGTGIEFHGIEIRQAEQFRKELEGTGALTGSALLRQPRRRLHLAGPGQAEEGPGRFQEGPGRRRRPGIDRRDLGAVLQRRNQVDRRGVG